MKFLIWIGAALVLIGGVGYGWVHAEKKRKKAGCCGG